MPGPVGEHHDAVGADRLGLHQLQRGLLGVVAEQPLPAAEENRVDHQPVLVHEAALGQRLHELRAPVDQDVVARLPLQLGDVVQRDDGRVLPARVLERAGDHVLGHPVHLVGELPGLLRPGLGEALVGGASQQERARLADLVHLDGVALGAAVELEGPAQLAGLLDDAVEGHERGDDDLPHGRSLSQVILQGARGGQEVRRGREVRGAQEVRIRRVVTPVPARRGSSMSAAVSPTAARYPVRTARRPKAAAPSPMPRS